MYIITNMGIHKVMGTNYRYKHLIYIQYELANVLIYTITKVIQSVRNKFSTLNRFELSTDK